MEHVIVDLGSRSYPVVLARDGLGQIGSFTRQVMPDAKRAIVVTSADIGMFYGRTVLDSLQGVGMEAEAVQVPEGEAAKSWEAIAPVLSRMAQTGLDRGSVVVALGGGAIGDAAGFAAGVYMRGVRLVQVPTTLLAMVDSSVGGKTGVNLPEGKNLAGVFHQPSLVLIDPSTLRSLRGRELRAGAAELVKAGAVRDPDLFAAIAKGVPEDWTPEIKRGVEIKARIVEADERETSGLRAILNFGHTLGHAIEAAAGFGGLLHGEAVAIGMVGEAYLSVKRAGLPMADAVALASALEAHNLPVVLGGLPIDIIKEHLMRDKKFSNGRMRFVLLTRIGDAVVSDAVTMSDVDEALEMIR